MDEAQQDSHRWPILKEDDEKLLEAIMSLLTTQAIGDPYGEDGAFAENISSLSAGLRAMAATHWLDISLTLDSITWHFGNFGEPQLVRYTEQGLIELGLTELAKCFREAEELMLPLLQGRTETDGGPDEILEKRGLDHRADEINRTAWDLHDSGSGRSAIYSAWIVYARKHPERVFAG